MKRECSTCGLAAKSWWRLDPNYCSPKCGGQGDLYTGKGWHDVSGALRSDGPVYVRVEDWRECPEGFEIDGDLYTITVPPRYFDDHLDALTFEDDFIWESVRKGGRWAIKVTLTEKNLRELRSRASYYAEEPDFELGLRSSARATVRAIDKATAERGESGD